MPLNFQTITIDRRDGTCKAHSKDQIDFLKFDGKSETNDTKKPSPMMEVNRNIDRSLLPSSSASSSKSCRPSAAKSLNQNYIYGSEDYSSGSGYSTRFFRQESMKAIFHVSSTTSPIEKCATRLAFTMDPLFNNLWVYNDTTKSISCYNILASELRTMGVQVGAIEVFKYKRLEYIANVLLIHLVLEILQLSWVFGT